ncbi:phosphoenolpyruvate synthase [Candidatus Magnetomorum sp. HK-1]|nr:phosphoenolpyruvate synthase [Candidatus Magnetomorum sp. HK-1]
MNHPPILWLGEQLCNDILLVGAKAANLSPMVENYPIPPGFSVASSFFKGFDKQFNIDRITDKLSPIVADAYKKLGEKCNLKEPSVAVRSSAIDEDNINASFAGQFKTYLNVKGCENVIQAIINCYQSAFSERVLAYRTQKQMTSSSAMSILVQQLVSADMSSVVFSKNPMNDDASEIIINANWGLGESIVNGTVTPDTYIVNKKDLSIKQKMVAKKSIMSIICPQDGTKDVAIPKVMSDTPVMTDQQIIENAALAQKLENAFCMNIDLECAWKDEILYLLQCRPITTGINT